MKWTPRQLMLPVIIGMTLTGIGLAFIYVLTEREKDKDKTTRVTKGIHRAFITREIQVGKEFVPAIIGRGGSMIKSIEYTTGTRIRFNDDHPDLAQRVCFIKGPVECIRMAEAMIENVIASQPLIETYETHIPHRVCTKLIGRVGETINRIQSLSKAKIIIEQSWSQDPNSKRRVIMKGTAEQIASALSHIEDIVHEYNETLEKLVAGESSRSPRAKISPRIAAVNPSADIPLLTPLIDGKALNEGIMEVYVSAIQTPNQFWVQAAGSGTLSLDELVAEMTSYYANEENRMLHALKTITLGQTIAAKFLFDGKWYRAEIMSILKDDEYEVYFLDYGDHEVVSIENILELRTDFLSLRLQAIECSMANVKPRDGEWSIEAIERFGDLTWVAQWKVLIAKVRGYKERTLGCGSSRREGSPIPCIDLYDKNNNQDINIGKQMVVENLAEAEEGAWSAASSTLSLSRPSIDNATSPTPVRSSSPPSIVNNTTTTPKARKTSDREIIKEIDLTTPQRSNGKIEEIDLVTPEKNATRGLMENPKSTYFENGGRGDAHHSVYGNNDFAKENGNSLNCPSTKLNILPAGYESDESHNSDDFTLG